MGQRRELFTLTAVPLSNVLFVASLRPPFHEIAKNLLRSNFVRTHTLQLPAKMLHNINIVNGPALWGS